MGATLRGRKPLYGYDSLAMVRAALVSATGFSGTGPRPGRRNDDWRAAAAYHEPGSPGSQRGRDDRRHPRHRRRTQGAYRTAGPGHRDRRGLTRWHRAGGEGARRGGLLGERAHAPVRPSAGQGRRDVAEPVGCPRRHHHVRRRRHHGLPRALRVRDARPAARRPRGPVLQGGLPAALHLGRQVGRRWWRPGHRADGEAAAQPVLPRSSRGSCSRWPGSSPPAGKC